MTVDRDFIVSAAGRQDLQDLLDLYRHFGHDDPEPDPEIAADRWSSILLQPGMTVLIGRAYATAVSSATLIVIPNLTRLGAPYALIENVVTHAGHRRKGYAHAVVTAAIDAAWAAGCYKVMLMTGSKDPATLRFYETCGFDRSKTGFQIRRP